MGCAAAPAILIRTAILTARIASYTLAPTMDLGNATDPVASRRAAGDGLRRGPGDSDPNGDPAARIANCTPRHTHDYARYVFHQFPTTPLMRFL
jgi:hypothetical protein